MKRIRVAGAGCEADSAAAISRLRSADGNGDANAIELATGEGRGTGNRPAGARPRERIRDVDPEEVHVDQAIDVDETARDQVAILLAHRHVVEVVQREILNEAVVARDLLARDAAADVNPAADRRFELRAHEITRLLDRSERRD